MRRIAKNRRKQNKKTPDGVIGGGMKHANPHLADHLLLV